MFVVKIQTEMFIDETEKTWYKKRKHAPEGPPPFQSQSSTTNLVRILPISFVSFQTQKEIHLALLYEASAATALAKRNHTNISTYSPRTKKDLLT